MKKNIWSLITASIISAFYNATTYPVTIKAKLEIPIDIEMIDNAKEFDNYKGHIFEAYQQAIDALEIEEGLNLQTSWHYGYRHFIENYNPKTDTLFVLSNNNTVVSYAYLKPLVIGEIKGLLLKDMVIFKSYACLNSGIKDRYFAYMSYCSKKHIFCSYIHDKPFIKTKFKHNNKTLYYLDPNQR